MNKFIIRSLIAIFMFCNVAYADKGTDLRILIDASGSMKKNDPDNHRAAAMRMVTKLLPKNTKAGVWIFETYSVPLIPWGEVNETWVEQAEQEINTIHSNGLYTNIKDVLQISTFDWMQDENLENDKVVVLLTDGIVDISKNEQINELSRQDIINNLIPEIKSKNIQVHTIALSDNADKELLKKLSVNTDALYQEVKEAKDLRKIFLNIFENSVPLNTVPIEDNGFLVDKSVKELTLLVFKESEKTETKLRLPNKEILDKGQESENINWYSEDDLDLITIKEPSAGKWKILGELNANNKAIIVSDFTLNTSKLPTNLFVNERLPFRSSLTTKGKIIDNKAFLILLDVYLEEPKEFGSPKWTPFLDNGKYIDKKKSDGLYSVVLGPVEKDFEGKVKEIRTVVRGKTFQRVTKQNVNVLPFPVGMYSTIGLDSKGDRVLKIDFILDEELIDVESLSANLYANDGRGNKEHKLGKYDKEDPWSVELYPKDNIEKYKVVLKVKGNTVSGRRFALTSDEQSFFIPKKIPSNKIIETKSMKKKKEVSSDEKSMTIVKAKKEVKKEEVLDDELSILEAEMKEYEDENKKEEEKEKQKKEMEEKKQEMERLKKEKEKKMQEEKKKKDDREEQLKIKTMEKEEAAVEEKVEEKIPEEPKVMVAEKKQEKKEEVNQEEKKEETVEEKKPEEPKVMVAEKKEEPKEEPKEEQKPKVDMTRELDRALSPGRTITPKVVKKPKPKMEDKKPPVIAEISEKIDALKESEEESVPEAVVSPPVVEQPLAVEQQPPVVEQTPPVTEAVAAQEQPAALPVTDTQPAAPTQPASEQQLAQPEVAASQAAPGQPAEEVKEEKVATPEEEVAKDTEEKKEEKPKKKAKRNVGLIIGLIVLFNTLIFGGGIGAYFFIKRRNSQKNKEVSESEDEGKDKGEDKK